jgi:hypothetical protein
MNAYEERAVETFIALIIANEAGLPVTPSIFWLPALAWTGRTCRNTKRRSHERMPIPGGYVYRGENLEFERKHWHKDVSWILLLSPHDGEDLLPPGEKAMSCGRKIVLQHLAQAGRDRGSPVLLHSMISFFGVPLT